MTQRRAVRPGRQRRPGPRGRGPPRRGGEDQPDERRARRPRHEGGHGRRPADARAPRGRGDLRGGGAARARPGCCARRRTASGRPTRSASSRCAATGWRRSPTRQPLLHRVGRGADRPGSAVTIALEGTRPLAVEIQALSAPASYGSPRRATTGVDTNRVLMLIAVLARHAGLNLTSHDVYVNVAGGLRIDEPAADLAIAAALASSLRDRPIAPATVLAGEVALSGRLRGRGARRASPARGHAARVRPDGDRPGARWRADGSRGSSWRATSGPR